MAPQKTVTIAVAVPPGVFSVTFNLMGSAGYSRSGGTSASASSGQGGWQIIDRARKKAATEWLDYYPMVMTMDAMFDGGAGLMPNSVESQIATLETFEVPATGSFPPLPPVLIVSGPVAHTDLFWVCSKLTFPGGDDTAIRDVNGVRTQQYFSIELTEYSPSSAITDPNLSPAQQAAQGLPLGTPGGLGTVAPSGQNYTVIAGDTLESIAAKQLGNVLLWTQLALLNGLPNGQILAAGTVLQLPAPV